MGSSVLEDYGVGISPRSIESNKKHPCCGWQFNDLPAWSHGES
jgi:hypothetical protein